MGAGATGSTAGAAAGAGGAAGPSSASRKRTGAQARGPSRSVSESSLRRGKRPRTEEKQRPSSSSTKHKGYDLFGASLRGQKGMPRMTRDAMMMSQMVGMSMMNYSRFAMMGGMPMMGVPPIPMAITAGDGKVEEKASRKERDRDRDREKKKPEGGAGAGAGGGGSSGGGAGAGGGGGRKRPGDLIEMDDL
mmetsp:Transcript_12725/g.45044  ORF Transcript_12725/g.45044 Transcript_12725/m.45044 type:complete len:191 (-) Transcript_12725:238-810(-)